MSYQLHAEKVPVVACDLCERIGAIGDRDWREMRTTAAGQRLHLCPQCRGRARWCEVHQAYHAPTDLHRCACAECGGLHTSVVADQIAYCPSCMRRHARPPSTAPRTNPLRQVLRSWLHNKLR